MSAISADLTVAKRLGFAPDPAKDGNSTARQRVLSALKWIGVINEILALQGAAFLRVYQSGGTTLPAGPIRITGFFNGLGYLVNGTFAAGVQSINVDTGTVPIAIGSLFTIAGIYSNSPTNSVLQVFTSTVALTGAGALTFTPALTAGAADNAVIAMDAGYRIAKAVGKPAHALLLSSLADKVGGYAFFMGQFTGSINTSGAAFGDPVYLKADGSYSLTADVPGTLPFLQVVAQVETKANPGVLRGAIQMPAWYGLFDSDGEVSVDADARVLFDDTTSASVDWEQRLLLDADVGNSVDWENRELVNAASQAIFNWQNGHLSLKPGTPAAFASNTDNLVLPLAELNHITTDGSGAKNLTGIVASTVNGYRLTLVNIGADAITLKNLATSTAANQFRNSTGADIVLAQHQAADLYYDTTLTKWRVFKRN